MTTNRMIETLTLQPITDVLEYRDNSIELADGPFRTHVARVMLADGEIVWVPVWAMEVVG